MKPDYQDVIVESYYESGSGLHGNVHIRPLPGQDPFLQSMRIECSGKLKKNYPVGTRFRIKAIITSRESGTPFIYNNYNWPFDVLD